jgi:hypothetical protein
MGENKECRYVLAYLVDLSGNFPDKIHNSIFFGKVTTLNTIDESRASRILAYLHLIQEYLTLELSS